MGTDLVGQGVQPPGGELTQSASGELVVDLAKRLLELLVGGDLRSRIRARGTPASASVRILTRSMASVALYRR
ncbi:hypothetical protein [Streptomyces sp. NPDC057002]|uniref:hypothetical protein n=1 Tax=Streptomyces sp. NPDC057002 TaxID=3345992 RepID=UPI00363DA429